MDYKRTLQDLNLIDSFLFNEMLAHEKGDWFASMLIERITGIQPAKVHVVSERVVQGTDSDKHGIQIDAYIEASEMGDAESKIFDVEPNVYRMGEEELPRRGRYYQSIIDAKLLPSGNDYKKLKDSITIFILTYDPFGKGHIKYTFKRKCLEYPEIQYDDGQSIIYLYTKGKCEDSEYGKKLSDMLKYFEDSSISTAGSDSDLKMAQDMVENIRKNSKKGAKYMNLFEEKMFERREGRAEGKANLLEELVRKKLDKGVLEKDLPELLEQDEETIKSILDKIREEDGVLV